MPLFLKGLDIHFLHVEPCRFEMGLVHVDSPSPVSIEITVREDKRRWAQRLSWTEGARPVSA